MIVDEKLTQGTDYFVVTPAKTRLCLISSLNSGWPELSTKKPFVLLGLVCTTLCVTLPVLSLNTAKPLSQAQNLTRAV